MFFKIGVLKISQVSQENTCAGVSFYSVFLGNLKIVKSTFFLENTFSGCFWISVKSKLGWSLEPNSGSFLAPANFSMHPRFTMSFLSPKINKNKIIAITWKKYFIINLVLRGFCLYAIRATAMKHVFHCFPYIEKAKIISGNEMISDLNKRNIH